MKDYEIYRIQHRNYSANIIEGGYVKDGKMIWEPLVAPLVSKKEGDVLTEELLEYLTDKN